METSQTAALAFRVLDSLSVEGPAPIATIAERIGVGRNVAQRLVSTLHYRSLVLRNERGEFELGPGLLELSSGMKHPISKAAQPALSSLAHRVQDLVILEMKRGDELAVECSANGSKATLQVEFELGSHHSISAGACGQVVRAYGGGEVVGPDAELELRRRSQVKELGYAYSTGEPGEGLGAIAVPILGQGGSVLGAISIVAPEIRAHLLIGYLEPLERARDETIQRYQLELEGPWVSGSERLEFGDEDE